MLDGQETYMLDVESTINKSYIFKVWLAALFGWLLNQHQLRPIYSYDYYGNPVDTGTDIFLMKMTGGDLWVHWMGTNSSITRPGKLTVCDMENGDL